LDDRDRNQDEMPREPVGPDPGGEHDCRICNLPRGDHEPERDRRVGDLQHGEHEGDNRDAVAEPGDRRACEEKAEIPFG
jgi:hypothetical protein